MMSALRRTTSRYVVYGLAVLAATVMLGVAGISAQQRVLAQSADSIYIVAASGSYGVGSSFTVSIRENSSTQVNAVQADLAYSSNLQFVSFDASGSAFGIDASSTGGGGVASTARGTITPVSGDQLVAKITFKVVAAGTGAITMQNSSVVLSSSTNSDVVNSRNGGSYTLQNTATTTPASPGATPPAVLPTPSGSSATTKKPVANLPTTTIAPQGSAQAAGLPGDTTIELETPATIVTTPDPTRSVSRVEYLINGRVVSTDAEAPYTHSMDTTKYRNGTYILTTKTYYNDGKVDTSNASITVKNKFGVYQLWLQLRHYAWIVAIVLVIAAELVYLKFFRRASKKLPSQPQFGGFGSMAGNSGAPTVVSPPQPVAGSTPSVITPTNQNVPNGSPVSSPDVPREQAISNAPIENPVQQIPPSQIPPQR